MSVIVFQEIHTQNDMCVEWTHVELKNVESTCRKEGVRS